MTTTTTHPEDETTTAGEDKARDPTLSKTTLDAKKKNATTIAA